MNTGKRTLNRVACSINVLLVMLSVSICRSQTIETRDEFKKYFDAVGVEGSFSLYDLHHDKYILCNKDQFKRPFRPASTYKICNSLVGLETGVIKDENFVIKWDSVVRERPEWNKDHDLKSAIKVSAVWYYQELARRVGGKRMKYWLDKAGYGNRDTSGGIDRFWLTGGLRVTPEQQIDFLKSLYANKLPFSQRTLDIVKKIIIVQNDSSYTLRAKTGWHSQENENIGWYVGYLETKDNVYFFATCIQCLGNNPNFAKARIDITLQILKDLKLL